MIRRLLALKDTYVTNRISRGVRVEDANVGEAGTLDLFHLWNEHRESGSSDVHELSRILIKFDLDPVRDMIASGMLDPSDPSFFAYVTLHDVYGGQPTPSNFTIDVLPLSRSFDEGIGRDVVSYRDVDVANWLTASISQGEITWVSGGAGATGTLGSTVDAIVSGDLGDGFGVTSLRARQVFDSSNFDDDLVVDVTRIVSATLGGVLPDEGFRISFSDEIENMRRSHFAKRFASRHVTKPELAPTLYVGYDDSLIDATHTLVFNTSGSIYRYVRVGGRPTNLMSGSTPLTGSGVMKLKLYSGSVEASASYVKLFDVDQHRIGNTYVTGVYVANVYVDEFENQDLFRYVQVHSSASFTAVWSSLDGTVSYGSGSLIVKRPDASSSALDARRLYVTIPNHRHEYSASTPIVVRVEVYDLHGEREVGFVKRPRRRTPINDLTLYWRVIDESTQRVIIPFDTSRNGTRLSVDADGMFFRFWPGDLPIGRTYRFEFLITNGDTYTYIREGIPIFRVVP